jgi:hypothetical protein
VLLKTAIKDSNGISSQVEQPVASTLRPQIIVNDASTSKNGKRGKKAKAKSMVDMPGVAMRSVYSYLIGMISELIGPLIDRTTCLKSRFISCYRSRSC